MKISLVVKTTNVNNLMGLFFYLCHSESLIMRFMMFNTLIISFIVGLSIVDNCDVFLTMILN